MKLAVKNTHGRWENIGHVRTYSVNEEVIIITLKDGNIRLFYRDEIEQIRTVKVDKPIDRNNTRYL